MAQRGWITKQQRKKNGHVWVYHWYLLKPETGKKVEHTCVIGAVADLPSEKNAWREIDRRHLKPQLDQKAVASGRLTFGDLAASYRENGMKKLAVTTQYTVRHYIDDYLLPRWGSSFALDIQPLDIEQWLGSLKRSNPTKDKIRRIMSVIYTGAEVWARATQRIVQSRAVGRAIGEVQLQTNSGGSRHGCQDLPISRRDGADIGDSGGHHRRIHPVSVQPESRGNVRVAKKPLDRFHVRSLVDQPTCQPMAEVVETESLPLPQLHPGSDCRGTEVIGGQNAARPRFAPLASRTREDPVRRPRVDRLPLPAAQAVGQEIGERNRSRGIVRLQTLHDRVLHPDPTKVDLLFLVVNVFPLQAHRFADTNPRRCHDWISSD
jgi:hypothetical protein